MSRSYGNAWQSAACRLLADRVGHHVSDEAAQHPQAHLPRPQQAFELPTINSISIRLINQDLTFSCAKYGRGGATNSPRPVLGLLAATFTS
jgi:hypothetical protein